MKPDPDLDAMLLRLEELEAGLDPLTRRRGQLIADVATLAVLSPIAASIDWPSIFVPAGLILVAIGLNRFVWDLRTLPDRRERDALLAELGPLRPLRARDRG